MTYDRENRLTEARSQESVVSYTYDPLGRLIRRIAGNTTNCLYYAGWQLIAEYDGTGALQRKYVYGPGIDEPIRVTSGGASYFYHADGLGSVTEITDNAGQIVENYRCDAFGAPTFYNTSGVVTNASIIGNRLLFTGRDRDADTGWYNYRHRYYNPALGRFVQPDALWHGNNANLYGYCLNNPLRFLDPEGKSAAEAHDYWEYIARSGQDRGGGFGNLQTAGASLMNAFLDFWGATDIETSAAESGWYSAVSGCHAKALRSGLWSAAMIGMAAMPGGGKGGAAFSRDAQALIELAKEAKHTGVTRESAKELLKWAKEYGLTGLDHIDSTHWRGGSHIRIGPVNHIPVR